MSNRVFPTAIKGLTYTVVRTPKFATLVQSSAAGQEVRIAQRANPIWEWQFTWDYIYNNWPGSNNTKAFAPWTDLQTFVGFFMAALGEQQSYLYQDPDDNAVGPALLSTGWAKNTAYAIGALGNILDSNSHWQQVIAGGTSGSSAPSWNSSGGTTTDGSVTWLDMGSYASGFPNPQALLQVVDDGAGNYYAPLQRNMGGQSGWEDITDLNPGPSSLALYADGAELSQGDSAGDYVVGGPGLSIPGFASSGLYAQFVNQVWHAFWETVDQTIVDPYGNLQYAPTYSGLGTGSTEPTWNQTVGGTTTDGGVTWTNLGYNSGPGVVSAAFSYYFRVRTATDSQDFEKWAAQLWTIGGGSSRNGSGQFKVTTAFPSQKPAARFFGTPLSYPTSGGSLNWGHNDPLLILGDLAIGMWIRLPSNAAGTLITRYALVPISDQGVNAYELDIYGDGPFDITYWHEYVTGNEVYSHTFPTSIPVDQWTYVGITRNSTAMTVTCYVGNGQALRTVGTWSYANNPDQDWTACQVLVGVQYSGAQTVATIQEHYIASRQWSVSDHIAAMLGTPPSYELQLACSMGNTPEIDYSPNAFSGTVVGSLLVGGH